MIISLLDTYSAVAGDLTAGFWLLEVDSRAEATEWGRRLPFPDGDVEIREVTTTR